jgi:hypothetical protein
MTPKIGQCILVPVRDLEVVLNCYDNTITENIHKAHPAAQEFADKTGDSCAVLQVVRISNPTRVREQE